MRQFPETDPAELELPVIGPRSTAPRTAVILPDAKLRGPMRFGDDRFFCHPFSSLEASDPKRHSEEAEKLQSFLVGSGRRYDRYVHSPYFVYFIVVYLRKYNLFPYAKRIVPPSVESFWGNPPEIPQPRDRHAHELVEEIIHPVLAERDLDPDRDAFPEV